MIKSISYKGDYPYIIFHNGCNFEKDILIWVAKDLIEKDEDGNEFVRVTGNKRKLIKTKKGNYILVSGNENDKVFFIETNSGFRGTAKYEIIEGNVLLEISLLYCHSPRGNLGIDNNALIYTNDDFIIYKEKRTGRLYGKPSERYWKLTVDKNGNEVCEEIAPIEDDELSKLI